LILKTLLLFKKWLLPLYRFGTRISFDDKIEAVLGNQIVISSVLEGVVLFVDGFKPDYP
jgi:hypothetical protein